MCVCVCVCFTLPPAPTNVMYRSFLLRRTMSEVEVHQTGERNTSLLGISVLCPPLHSSCNPSLTKHFLCLFLPRWLSLIPVLIHTHVLSSMKTKLHTCTSTCVCVSNTHRERQIPTHTESGWGHCLESGYYSRHPKGRNPVTPSAFQ